jgi:hypothetical protein
MRFPELVIVGDRLAVPYWFDRGSVSTFPLIEPDRAL